MKRAAEVTGQLLFWNRGPGPLDGINMVMTFGVLGMPKELAETFCADDMMKRLVLGNYVPDLGIRLLVQDDAQERIPNAEYHKFQRVDQLLCSPVWRI